MRVAAVLHESRIDHDEVLAEKASPGTRYQNVPVKQTLDEREFGRVIDLGHDLRGVEARVLGTLLKECEQALDVGGAAGNDWENLRPFVRPPAERSSVAESAISSYADVADRLLGKARRHLLALFPRRRSATS